MLDSYSTIFFVFLITAFSHGCFYWIDSGVPFCWCCFPFVFFSLFFHTWVGGYAILFFYFFLNQETNFYICCCLQWCEIREKMDLDFLFDPYKGTWNNNTVVRMCKKHYWLNNKPWELLNVAVLNCSPCVAYRVGNGNPLTEGVSFVKLTLKLTLHC